MSTEKIPCPNCRADLRHTGDVRLFGWVSAKHDDTEGKDRADLILQCEECKAEFNAFVPLDAFMLVEGENL